MTKNIITENRYLTALITGCFCSIALLSCQSHEQKADDAFTRVKEGKAMQSDSQVLLPEPKKKDIVRKTESLDAWSLFKIETEKRIAINDKKIRDIKNTPNVDAKLFKRISTSEQENADMRRQVNEYEENLRINLEDFKTKVNKNMDAIGSDLNDLAISSKK